MASHAKRAMPRQGHTANWHAPVTAAPERAYWLSWREAVWWERPVVDRAYAAGERWAAELVKVAGR